MFAWKRKPSFRTGAGGRASCRAEGGRRRRSEVADILGLILDHLRVGLRGACRRTIGACATVFGSTGGSIPAPQR